MGPTIFFESYKSRKAARFLFLPDKTHRPVSLSLAAYLEIAISKIMWKALNREDKVSVGDTIRFRSKSNSLPAQIEIYLIAKTDQHYFEIIKKADCQESEPPRRLVVRLIDVGYNILLERWSEVQDNSNDS